MKKGTAIFFVILANIIILAHAIVPHHHGHHHSAHILIITDHSNEKPDRHKHHIDDHSHEHENTNDYDFCLLKQVVSTLVNNSKQEFSAPFNNFTFGNTPAILIENDFACNPPPLLSFQQPLFHNSDYTCFVNGVSGLRAPPAI